MSQLSESFLAAASPGDGVFPARLIRFEDPEMGHRFVSWANVHGYSRMMVHTVEWNSRYALVAMKVLKDDVIQDYLKKFNGTVCDD